LRPRGAFPTSVANLRRAERNILTATTSLSRPSGRNAPASQAAADVRNSQVKDQISPQLELPRTGMAGASQRRGPTLPIQNTIQIAEAVSSSRGPVALADRDSFSDNGLLAGISHEIYA